MNNISNLVKLQFNSLLAIKKNLLIISIIIRDGRTTPSVATAAPKTPSLLKPINVAIFMANGPGVDSLIPIKSIISEICAIFS